MGHDVVYCGNCGTPVMEGYSGEWTCSCGWHMNANGSAKERLEKCKLYLKVLTSNGKARLIARSKYYGIPISKLGKQRRDSEWDAIQIRCTRAQIAELEKELGYKHV